MTTPTGTPNSQTRPNHDQSKGEHQQPRKPVQVVEPKHDQARHDHKPDQHKHDQPKPAPLEKTRPDLAKVVTAEDTKPHAGMPKGPPMDKKPQAEVPRSDKPTSGKPSQN